ncbi:DNA damage-regulated autophagy modulator protein 1 isoform X2 [Amia ocellicauda]
MFWLMEGMCFLPTFLVIWSSCSFIVSYIISLFEHHVPPVFPYISDTGTHTPESGIFSIMIVISAFLGVATMYTRYKFVEKLNEATHTVNPRLNHITFYVGLIGCMGMCVVASFQETVITSVHDIGALIAFLFGVIYILLQSIVSYMSVPHGSSLPLCRVRMVISIISVVAVFPMIICAIYVNHSDPHWESYKEEDPYRMASAVCEWIVAFGFIFYFLTYIKEFQT